MSEVKVDKISPRSGTDVTLGDASDTFTIPASATLDVNGTIDVTGATVTGLSAGKVLQVVQVTKTDAVSVSNSGSPIALVSTGLEGSITPASTSNKVLILLSFNLDTYHDCYPYYQVYRDLSALTGAMGAASGTKTRSAVALATQWETTQLSLNYLDSPGVDTSTTYKLMWGSSGVGYLGLNAIYMNRTQADSNDKYVRSASYMTLMEIEG